MAVSDVSQKYDVIIRIFEILKYQNIPALTVWPIVPITFLVLNNHQSGRIAAKNSNSAEIAFFTFCNNETEIRFSGIPEFKTEKDLNGWRAQSPTRKKIFDDEEANILGAIANLG